MHYSRVSFAVASLVAIWGCGGSTGGSSGGSGSGGSGSTSTPVGSNSALFGDAKVSFTGKPQETVLGFEGGLTVSAFAGVSITSLVVDPAPSLNNAPIYYVQNGTVSSYLRGASQPAVFSPNHQALSGDVSKSGQLYFVNINATTGNQEVGKCNLDGTGYTTIFSGGAQDVRISPDGSKLVFEDGPLYTCSNTGTNLAVLDNSGYEGCISPDGTTVAYIKYINSYDQVFTKPINGGASTQITTDLYNHSYPQFSPDGALILCDVDSGSKRIIESYLASGSNVGQSYEINYFPTVPFASDVRFSPDGKFLAVLTSTNYSTALQTPLQVAIQDLAGNNYQTIANGNEVIWPTYPSSKSFVGTSGTLFTSSAGFIYSQFQPGFASIVAFTATTPSKATVTLATGNGSGGPAVYDCHADAVTGVKYANGYYTTPISISFSQPDALVSIDTTTGLVTTVAPFNLVKGASLEKAIGVGSATFKAHFSAVYDSKGKNVAPQGASTITVDSKHGKVLSFG